MLFTCGMPLIYTSRAVELAPGNPAAAGLERAVYSPSLPAPSALIAQAAPNPPRRPASPVSLSTCILIDNSGSMGGKQSEVKDAAFALVTASRPGDELCIVDFNDEAYLAADLSTNFAKARDAIRQVNARGGSALRDAIQMSVDLVEQKAHNRKVLVLITDGNDTSSAFTEQQMRDKIKNSGVLVYSIALLNEPSSGEASQARRTLTQLAALTGGLYYHPGVPAEIESIASAIERDARNK